MEPNKDDDSNSNNDVRNTIKYLLLRQCLMEQELRTINTHIEQEKIVNTTTDSLVNSNSSANYKSESEDKKAFVVVQRHVSEFYSCVSLPGLQYLGDAGRHLPHRMLWLAVQVVAVAVSFSYIGEAYSSWQGSPVVLSLNNTLTHVGRVPFPAVTICLPFTVSNDFNISKAQADCVCPGDDCHTQSSSCNDSRAEFCVPCPTQDWTNGGYINTNCSIPSSCNKTEFAKLNAAHLVCGSENPLKRSGGTIDSLGSFFNRINDRTIDSFIKEILPDCQQLKHSKIYDSYAGFQYLYDVCSAHQVRFMGFKDTPLCLTYNSLSPENMFETDVDLGINQISSLNRDTFKGLSRLTELDMFDNRIDFLPNVIFDNLESLTHLRLNRNRMEELHDKVFHKLANLETLDLSSNALRRLAARLFRGTPRLVVLHLAGNGLEELPESVFRGLVRLEELDLSSNVLLELPLGIFKGLAALKRLKLHDNRLKQLPPGVFGDLQFLDVLTLRRNRLTFIRPGLFDSQRHLTHLELTGNWISTLSGQEFLKLPSLRELHLGQNYLEHIPEGTFRECGQLDKLFLFSNNLATLETGTFTGLGNLTNLLLNNNLLRLMAETVFEPLTNLKKLQVDSNKFQYLPTDCLEYVPNLVSLKLAKNPWHCDCAILYLATWLRDNRRKVWDSSPTCRGPGDLGGRLVDEMNFDDLCDGQWASMVKLTPRVPIK